MKRLSLYLFLLLFTLQTPSWADDIRDFQIEGMSIGDSLLDYMTKKEIMKAEENAFIYDNKNFLIIFAPLNSEIYDDIQITYKLNDKKYLIYAMDGVLLFPNNIEGCRKKMKEIVKEIEADLSGTIKTEDSIPHYYDRSGKSMAYSVKFDTKSGGRIDVFCTDWTDEITKEKRWDDELKVFIGSNEFLKTYR